MRIISYDDIKGRLAFRDGDRKEIANRKLGILSTDCDTSGSDVIFFALKGSPPGGYGLFIKALGLLNLYDRNGDAFHNIYIDEVVSSYLSATPDHDKELTL